MTNLAVRILDLAPVPVPDLGENIILQSRFDAGAARRELLHHHRDWLARGHAFTGFALLSLTAAFGLAQHYGYVAGISAAIPTAVALVAVLVITTLGALCLLTVAAATEPLLTAIARLPVERLDIALLRTTMAVAEGGGVRPDSTSALVRSVAPLLERLAVALERGRDSLGETIARLSANAETFTAAAQAISQPPADSAAMAKLSSAIDQLATAVGGVPPLSSVGSPISEQAPQARINELRNVLRDLE